MKVTNTILYIIILFFIMLISANACSDDSTSAEMDDPPGLPTEIAPVLIDTQYFQNQNIPDEEQHSSYKSVEMMATFGSSVLQAQGTINMVNSFLVLAPVLNVSPEFIDGAWVWEFDLTGFLKEIDSVNQTGDEQIIIRIFATPVNNGVEWVIRYTGMLGDVMVENFQFISGFTSDDGTSGEWRFFDPAGGSTPFATYTWEVQSPTEQTAVLTVIAFGEFNNITVEYNQDGAENWLNFEPGNGEFQRVYWNTDTNSGWYEDFQTTRQCYVNFENASCS